MDKISVEGDVSSHGGAPFDTGLSSDVMAGGKGVALASQSTSSSNDSLYNIQTHPEGIAANQKANVGSGTVFANNKPVHRVNDARIDGTTAGPGISTVKVG